MEKHSVVANLVGKKALILSDHSGLYAALELSLNRRLGLETVRLSPDAAPQEQAAVEDCDLIVVAMSSLANEPVVALAKASLTERVGKVPLLIVSDRPFLTDPTNRIAHLDFPFDIDSLCDRVREIMYAQPDPTGRRLTSHGERP